EQNQIEIVEVKKGEGEYERTYEELMPDAKALVDKYMEDGKRDDFEEFMYNYAYRVEFGKKGNIEKFVELDKEDTRHSAYQLPGGSQYREILLTLPESSDNISEKNRLAKGE